MRFQNNLAIQTNEQIADYVGCHASWVKQIKAKYFGSKSKNLTSEEKEKYQFHLNLVFTYQKIHSWKDVMIDIHQNQIEDIDPWLKAFLIKMKFDINLDDFEKQFFDLEKIWNLFPKRKINWLD